MPLTICGALGIYSTESVRISLSATFLRVSNWSSNNECKTLVSGFGLDNSSKTWSICIAGGFVGFVLGVSRPRLLAVL